MYCNQCGSPLQASQGFCGVCGKQAAWVPPAPALRGLAGQVRLLGIFWLALSALRLLGGGARLFGAGAVRFIGHNWFGHSRAFWPIEHFLPPLLAFAGMWFLILAVAGLVAGWGLLERRAWGRGLALILAVLSLLDPVLGTALGIYTLWVLLSSRAEQEYRQMAGPA